MSGAGEVEPKCEQCGWPLHRYRNLTLCQECEDASREGQSGPTLSSQPESVSHAPIGPEVVC